ncbi:MAG TPA: NAD(P)-dependent oxidoreductase [Gemmatimonadales bacterium]
MRPQQTVAVTGASGFVGGALVARLLPHVRVRALFRPGDARAERLADRGCEIVRGDLDDTEALRRLVRGADTVHHCAATMGRRDAARSRAVNVLGTERLGRAALECGVRRFVYVSSISVFAATRRSDPWISEAIAPEHVERLNAYGRTKYEGELRVRALATSGGLRYTIIRPTNVYGPGSGPWFHQWERMLRRMPIAIGDFPIDVIWIDDLVEAMLQAAESEAAADEVFHVGHEMVKLNEFVRALGRVVGRRVLKLPAPLDRAVRAGVDRLYRAATGRQMSLSLVHPAYYPHSKASKAFGFAPRVPLEDGVARLTDWWSRSREARRPVEAWRQRVKSPVPARGKP